MANRVVNVRLLVSASQFNQGMLQSGASVRVLANSLGTSQQQAQAANDALGDLAKAAGLAGGAITGAFAYGVKVFADFDQQMSAAGAAAGITGQELTALRQAAIDAGSATSYSATEAAGAIEELAKAGVSAADITGGALTGALNLAAAGGVDVADAANIAATAMTIFGLKGKDVAHVADVLTAAANKSQASVQDVSMAMNQSALIAKQTGLSLEDTAGALALFSSQGLNGSDAGTSFKTMLMSLNPRSKQAAALMDELGLRAYDASGKFVGLSQYAGLLQTGLSTLTDEQRSSALATIFGTDAIRAATVLYQAGSSGVDTWTAAVDDTGLAADTAAARTDNLAGDMERLHGAIESAILESGTGANNVLRDMAQRATDVVNGFAALPGPLQEFLSGAAGISGVLLTAGAGVILLRNQLLSLQASAAAAGSTRLAAGIGMMSKGMLAAIPIAAVAAIALDYYGRKAREHADSVKSLTDAIQADNGALGENTRKLLAQKNASNGAADAAEQLGISARDITDALTGNAGAAQRVNARIREVTDAVNKQNVAAGSYGPGGGGTMDASMQKNADAANLLTQVMGGQKSAIEDAKKVAGAYDKSLGDTAKVVMDGISVQSASAAAFGVTASSMKDQQDAADKLSTALDILSGNGISAVQAQDALDGKLADLKETIKGTGSALESTEPAWAQSSINARTNRGALLDLISAANATAEAMGKQGASLDEVSGTYGTNIQAIRDHAKELGLDEAAVDALLYKYGLTPEQITTAMKADTTNADAGIASVQRQFRDIDGTTATVTIQYESKGAAEAAAAYYNAVAQNTIAADAYGQRGGGSAGNNRATGGLVTGPGTAMSDSIPARLSNGEYVMRASAVDQYGSAFFDQLNGGGMERITDAGTYSSMRPVAAYSASPMQASGSGSDAVVGEVRQLRADLARLTNAHAATLVRSNEDVADRSRLAAMAGSSSVNR